MPRIRADSLSARRELIRTRLLDAVGAAVREHGFAPVSLADVAARAGIARNTVDDYAPDKTGLLLAHVERSVQLVVTQLAIETDPDVSPTQRLRDIVRAHLASVARGMPGREGEAVLEDVAGLLTGEARREMHDRFRPVLDLERTVDLMTGVIVAARRAAHAPDADADAVVQDATALVSFSPQRPSTSAMPVRMVSTPAAKSMRSQRTAHSSPRRAPVVMASQANRPHTGSFHASAAMRAA